MSLPLLNPYQETLQRFAFYWQLSENTQGDEGLHMTKQWKSIKILCENSREGLISSFTQEVFSKMGPLEETLKTLDERKRGIYKDFLPLLKKTFQEARELYNASKVCEEEILGRFKRLKKTQNGITLRYFPLLTALYVAQENELEKETPQTSHFCCFLEESIKDEKTLILQEEPFLKQQEFLHIQNKKKVELLPAGANTPSSSLGNNEEIKMDEKKIEPEEKVSKRKKMMWVGVAVLVVALWAGVVLPYMGDAGIFSATAVLSSLILLAIVSALAYQQLYPQGKKGVFT